jgi:DNA-binding LacI/PurR family transcriptional regulator
LNGRQYGNIRISQSTRERVQAAIRELGYAPNLAARGLAGGANKLLGVFTFQRLFPTSQDDFFYEFLVGIEEEAEETGFNLLLLTAAKDAQGRRSLYPQGTNGMQLADGGVLIGWDERPDEIRRLSEEGFPFVFLGRRDYPGLELSYVAADYAGATADLTGRVLAAGRSPALVDTVGHVEPAPGRLVGYRQAMAQAGRPERVLTVAQTAEAPELSELLEQVRQAQIDTLLVENARLAEVLEEAAGRSGVEILCLGGAPDPEQERGRRGLRIPRRQMGREAVRLLTRLLTEAGSAPLRTTLPCEITY